MLLSETVEELAARYDDCIAQFGDLTDTGWLQLICHPCISTSIIDEIICSDRSSNLLTQGAIARRNVRVDRTSDLATADPDVWFDAWSHIPTTTPTMIGWWAVTGGLLDQVGKATRTEAFFQDKIRDLVGRHLGMTAVPLDMLPEWAERYRIHEQAKLAAVEALYNTEPTPVVASPIPSWWDLVDDKGVDRVRVMDLARLTPTDAEAVVGLLVSELGDGEDLRSGTAWKMLFTQLDTIVDPETKLGLLISTAAKLAA